MCLANAFNRPPPARAIIAIADYALVLYIAVEIISDLALDDTVQIYTVTIRLDTEYLIWTEVHTKIRGLWGVASHRQIGACDGYNSGQSTLGEAKTGALSR